MNLYSLWEEIGNHFDTFIINYTDNKTIGFDDSTQKERKETVQSHMRDLLERMINEEKGELFVENTNHHIFHGGVFRFEKGVDR